MMAYDVGFIANLFLKKASSRELMLSFLLGICISFCFAHEFELGDVGGDDVGEVGMYKSA